MLATTERLVRYLTEAHAAEVGYRKMFEAFNRDNGDASLCVLFQEQVQLSQHQETRLEKCLSKFGSKPNDTKDFLNTVMAKVGDVVHTTRDPSDQAVQDLLKGFGLAQTARAMYAALAEYARGYGDQDIADVAEAAGQEKLAAAERLWPMITKFAKATLPPAQIPV